MVKSPRRRDPPDEFCAMVVGLPAFAVPPGYTYQTDRVTFANMGAPVLSPRITESPAAVPVATVPAYFVQVIPVPVGVAPVTTKSVYGPLEVPVCCVRNWSAKDLT